MSLLDNMPHKVDILRPSYARDNLDVGNTEVFVRIDANVPAWVQNRSRSSIVEFQHRDQAIGDYVFFNQEPPLVIGDHVSVVSGPSRVGDDLEVKSFEERSAGLGKLWGALCEIDRTSHPTTVISLVTGTGGTDPVDVPTNQILQGTQFVGTYTTVPTGTVASLKKLYIFHIKPTAADVDLSVLGDFTNMSDSAFLRFENRNGFNNLLFDNGVDAPVVAQGEGSAINLVYVKGGTPKYRVFGVNQ